MHTSDKALIETLTRSKIFREYETAFREAVGMPLALTPIETWGLPLHEDRKENPFCREMAKNSRACAECLQTQATLSREAGESAATVTCGFGLSDSAVPVRLGNRLIGYLRTGQVFRKTPTEADFQKAMVRLQQWGTAVETERLREAYFSGKVVSPEQYEAILRLLKVFAEHLGSVSNQILVSEETAENPQIMSAKDFIERNMAEDINLTDCARAARMSTFYFCKMFKRETSLSFTEYLSRLRVEKAKARFLDPHVRVSEVAFEVGFQSLSQFNRVFRRVTGQSPSEYRQRMPLHKDADHQTARAETAPRPFKFGMVAPRFKGRNGPARISLDSVAAR